MPSIGFVAFVVDLDGASSSRVAMDVHSCVTNHLSKVAQALRHQQLRSGFFSIKK